MRFFIEIAYNGKAYHGWQKQPAAISVQEVLDGALSTALQENIEVAGAGRTDKGVHASQFFGHFDTAPLSNIPQLIFKLNTILPASIAVFSIFEVPPEAHVRFDAISRTYTYYVTTRKDPFKTNSAYYVKKKIDMDRMNEAAEMLLSYTDFKAFSKVKTEVKTYNCSLLYARWESEGDVLVFRIKADRFLRNMVRAVVGTLLDIGTGKTAVEHIKHVVESRNRGEAGKSVPAHALFLSKIEYPESIKAQ